MVIQHHEPECLQDQGYSKGSDYENMTLSTISSELLIFLVTILGLMVHHHKPNHLVKKLDYCIQSQGHSED